MKSDLRFNSRTIHGGQHPDVAYGAVMPPVYLTSTFAQSAPGEHKGYEYSRSGNPTRHALEAALASIESGNFGLAFSSGLAAMDAVLKLLRPGDEVLATRDLYGGSYRLFRRVFEPLGIGFRFEDLSRPGILPDAIGPRTRLIWLETPTNPMMNVLNIEAIADEARKRGLLLAVDNTFATPYLQQPLNLGADIVMHSATKYLGGHSDVVAGALIVSDRELADRLYFLQNACGAVLGPMDSYLVLRGIKTLHVRMQRHCENGRAIAEFLAGHPAVEKVYWPGLPDHPGHELAKKQMRDFGGMLSFIPKGSQYSDAVRLVSALEVFTLAESLGGVESLAGHPASMTHASIPADERAKSGVTDGLIRLSVGIEDAEDLIEDLARGLSLLQNEEG
jgi:cystathionine beta-lyase